MRLATRPRPAAGSGVRRAPQQAARRAAVVAPARASRGTTAMRVVAFRETHRAEQLINAATDFSSSWLRAQADGVSSSLMESMGELTDQRVQLLCHDPPLHTKHVGIDALEHFLDKSKGVADTSCCEVLLAAADDNSDCVFVLLGPNKSSPPSAKGETKHAPQYQVLKLDFLYDDGARSITTITHRSTAGAGAEGSVPLPLERLSATSAATCLSPEHSHKVASAWCRAHSSGQNGAEVLKPFLAPGFQLWDAYGHPSTTPTGGSKGSKKTSTSPKGDGVGMPTLVPPKDAAVRYLESEFLAGGICGGGSGTPEAPCSVECRLLDHAACMDSRASFSHWILTASGQGEGAPAGGGASGNIVREGMQVEVFDHEGRLTDVWLWTDPLIMPAVGGSAASHKAESSSAPETPSSAPSA